MAVDNTHTKYLKGSDKKAWEKYKAELEAQEKNIAFLNSFKLDDDGTFTAKSNRPQGNVRQHK